MGYDYDGTIEMLKQFKAEKEDLLKRVLANCHDELAGSVRESIASYDDTISRCERIRAEQSA